MSEKFKSESLRESRDKRRIKPYNVLESFDEMTYGGYLITPSGEIHKGTTHTKIARSLGVETDRDLLKFGFVRTRIYLDRAIIEAWNPTSPEVVRKIQELIDYLYSNKSIDTFEIEFSAGNRIHEILYYNEVQDFLERVKRTAGIGQLRNKS